MAPRVMEVMLALALISAVFISHTSAQSSGCTTATVSLVPCLGYITGNSSTPSASCCSQLSSVVQTQARCLCTLLNGSGTNLGFAINQTQALTLPGACNVQTPPLSQCNAAAAGPATAPSVAPSSTPSTPSEQSNQVPDAPSTPSVPSNPTVPSSTSTPSVPSGSKAVPADRSSDGSSIKSPKMVFAVFFIAACVSTFTTP